MDAGVFSLFTVIVDRPPTVLSASGGESFRPGSPLFQTWLSCLTAISTHTRGGARCTINTFRRVFWGKCVRVEKQTNKQTKTAVGTGRIGVCIWANEDGEQAAGGVERQMREVPVAW